MAIDPLRSGAPRISPLTTRGGDVRRPGPPVVANPTESTPEAGSSADPRRVLVQARIQVDYYSQSHIRERVIESLLQFLDEE